MRQVPKAFCSLKLPFRKEFIMENFKHHKRREWCYETLLQLQIFCHSCFQLFLPLFLLCSCWRILKQIPDLIPLARTCICVSDRDTQQDSQWLLSPRWDSNPNLLPGPPPQSAGERTTRAAPRPSVQGRGRTLGGGLPGCHRAVPHAAGAGGARGGRGPTGLPRAPRTPPSSLRRL